MADDPRTVTFQWYFVDEDTDVLPFGTAFTSNEWMDTPEGDFPVGEVAGAERTWVNGIPPYPVAGGPPCGAPFLFAFGMPAFPSTPTPTNLYGGIACCPLPASPFVHYDCVNCGGGAMNVYSLISNGANPAGMIAGSDGNFSVDYVGACEWQGPLIPLPNWPIPPPVGRWYFVARGTGVAAGLIINGINREFFTFTGAWDCNSLLRIPRNAAGIAAGAGPNVVLLPGIASGIGPFCVNQGAFLPSSLEIRITGVGRGIFSSILPQTVPLTAAGECVYRGVIWYNNSLLRFRFQSGKSCELRFLPGGEIELAGVGPRDERYFYSVTTATPWDLSPIALTIDPGTINTLGLPNAMTLFTQTNPPP